ncbi:MAG: hypothetical protein WB762_22665 [Candidatus Sulfotelmatobacter sp.]
MIVLEGWYKRLLFIVIAPLIALATTPTELHWNYKNLGLDDSCCNSPAHGGKMVRRSHSDNGPSQNVLAPDCVNYRSTVGCDQPIESEGTLA